MYLKKCELGRPQHCFNSLNVIRVSFSTIWCKIVMPYLVQTTGSGYSTKCVKLGCFYDYISLLLIGFFFFYFHLVVLRNDVKELQFFFRNQPHPEWKSLSSTIILQRRIFALCVETMVSLQRPNTPLAESEIQLCNQHISCSLLIGELQL